MRIARRARDAAYAAYCQQREQEREEELASLRADVQQGLLPQSELEAREKEMKASADEDEADAYVYSYFGDGLPAEELQAYKDELEEAAAAVVAAARKRMREDVDMEAVTAGDKAEVEKWAHALLRQAAEKAEANAAVLERWARETTEMPVWLDDALAAAEKEQRDPALTGCEAIANGRVAVVLLAGGMRPAAGGADGKGQAAKQVPAGAVPLELPSGKGLFQLQAERLARVQKLAAETMFGPGESTTLAMWHGHGGNWREREMRSFSTCCAGCSTPHDPLTGFCTAHLPRRT